MQETLAHYLALWTLENPQLIAETFSSHVYRVEAKGEVLALKILTEDGAYDEGGGAQALEYFAGYGAVRILNYDEGAHLLEFVAGEDLIPMVEAGQDDEATRISAEVLNKLHQRRGKAPELRSLRSWFRGVFEKAQADEVSGSESIYRRGAVLAEILLSEPREEGVLHADIHHANIRHHEKRGWLAFDPKGIYGERTYDAANMLYNPSETIAEDESRLFRTAGILSKALNLDYQRYLQFAFAYGCLSAAWSLEGDDEDMAKSTLIIAGMIETALTQKSKI
jgi:streptomycin 6-kinase